MQTDESDVTAMMSPQTSPSAQPSRLLDLPGELRNRIYRYAVVDEVVKWKDGFWQHGSSCDPSSPCPPPLARTCLQLEKEVSPIFYAESIFVVDYYPKDRRSLPSAVADWLQALESSGAVRLLRNFRFHRRTNNESIKHDLDDDMVCTINIKCDACNITTWDVVSASSALCCCKLSERFAGDFHQLNHGAKPKLLRDGMLLAIDIMTGASFYFQKLDCGLCSGAVWQLAYNGDV